MSRKVFTASISLFAALAFPCCSLAATTSPAADYQDLEITALDNSPTQYQHAKMAMGDRFSFTVSWNDPIAGQPLTLHCVGNSETANYKFLLRTPKYTDPALGWDYVQDPLKSKYTEAATSHDFEFTPMATGTYELRIDCIYMDGPPYETISATVTVAINDPAHPSVNARVQKAVKQCNQETDGSDYQKAVWLHDWLLDQVEYDNSFLYSSAEAALCRGTGTCQAYASAYHHLLDAAHIENKEVRDESDCHTWNAVKIDGEWCQVDCTWDDTDYSWQSINMRHYYFGLTDELMGTAHPHFNEVYEASDYATPSTSLTNGYHLRSGEANTWADAYVERVQAHLDVREPEFIIATDNASWPDSYKSIYNGYVAYILSQRTWIATDDKVTLNVDARDDSLVCKATYQTEAEMPGWNSVDGRLEYRDASGTRLVNRWLSDRGNWFYFGSDGFALTDKHTIGNTTYFFKSDCCMAVGWAQDEKGFWYYANPSGPLTKGWKKLGNIWYWFNPSTYHMATGWMRDGRTWYWFESSGAMRKQSWLLDNGTWYYLGASGAMETGWLSLNGSWYWFDSSGAMATGWRRIGLKWYYLQPSSGEMATGWLKLNGVWYYLSPSSGAMATGWQKINGTWYYFNSTGAMR